jgi:hypothetical protein
MAKTLPPGKTPPPFCKNCTHFIAESDTENNDGRLPRCRKFQLTDLVMGEQFYIPCSDVRSPNAPCGTAGKLFMPKIVEVKLN